MDFEFEEVPLGYIMNQFMPGGGFFYGPQFIPPQGPGFGAPGPGGMPPFGPPSGGPGGMPPFGPPSGGPGGGPPQGAPPAFTPAKPITQQGPGIYAVDPGAIRPCLFRFVYIWLRSGRSFWAFLVFVGRESVAGWRWNGFRWVYFGIDLDRIDAFVCY